MNKWQVGLSTRLVSVVIEWFATGMQGYNGPLITDGIKGAVSDAVIALVVGYKTHP